MCEKAFLIQVIMMSKLSKKANLNGWNNDTHLGVNLKTQLRSDRKMKLGKSYQGVLSRDVECDDFLYDEHFTFTETQPWSTKRNPKVSSRPLLSLKVPSVFMNRPVVPLRILQARV